jgi:hypothetical protein
MYETKIEASSQTNVISPERKKLDRKLQTEQHLYRKHLHTMALAVVPRMLIFLIAFISFNLENRKIRGEGM